MYIGLYKTPNKALSFLVLSCLGNMVAKCGAGGGALIPPPAGAQVNEAYTNLNVVQRSAVDSLFKCPEKSAIGSRDTHIVYPLTSFTIGRKSKRKIGDLVLFSRFPLLHSKDRGKRFGG